MSKPNVTILTPLMINEKRREFVEIKPKEKA